MTFTEDGHDEEILQLELYKILSCLEEMIEKGWIEPQQLAKWIKEYLSQKEKWEEPSEEEVGKWGEPEWEGEKEKWEEPEGKWGESKGKWGEPKIEEEGEEKWD